MKQLGSDFTSQLPVVGLLKITVCMLTAGSLKLTVFLSNNNGILHALSKDVNNWAAQVYMYRLSVKSGVSQVCRLSVSSWVTQVDRLFFKLSTAGLLELTGCMSTAGLVRFTGVLSIHSWITQGYRLSSWVTQVYRLTTPGSFAFTFFYQLLIYRSTVSQHQRHICLQLAYWATAALLSWQLKVTGHSSLFGGLSYFAFSSILFFS